MNTYYKSCLLEIDNLIKKFKKKKFLKLNVAKFKNIDKKNLIDCLNSTFVSTHGKKTKEFEKKISKILNNKKVVSTVNGTSALHVCLAALGVNKDQEVLLPSLNYIASPNCVKYLEATPHFVEINENDLCVCPIKLEKYLSIICKFQNNISINKKTGKKIRVLIVTNIFGHLADYQRLRKVCNKFKIKIVEDASESLGSYYKNKPAGTIGDLGVLSFNGNKIITTGGGGAVIINNNKYYKSVYSLITIGKKNKKIFFDYDRVGYNYRMPSINAALGISQLKSLKTRVKKNINLFKKYKKFFSSSKYFRLLEQPKNFSSNYWLQAIILKKNDKNLRNKILNYTNKKNFETRPAWALCHKLKIFSDHKKMSLKITNRLHNQIINLPSNFN
jgi:perosamine synthetase